MSEIKDTTLTLQNPKQFNVMKLKLSLIEEQLLKIQDNANGSVLIKFDKIKPIPKTFTENEINFKENFIVGLYLLTVNGFYEPIVKETLISGLNKIDNYDDEINKAIEYINYIYDELSINDINSSTIVTKLTNETNKHLDKPLSEYVPDKVFVKTSVNFIYNLMIYGAINETQFMEKYWGVDKEPDEIKLEHDNDSNIYQLELAFDITETKRPDAILFEIARLVGPFECETIFTYDDPTAIDKITDPNNDGDILDVDIQESTSEMIVAPEIEEYIEEYC